MSCIRLRKKKIGSHLGEGTFAHVYLGKYGRKTVAMKKINANKLKQARVDPMVEINILLQLDHPNVIRLYSFTIDENEVIHILEYASAGDLFGIWKSKGKFEESIAIQYIKEIANGLEYIHSKKIMHLDIKLENILIDVKGKVATSKIADFGHAQTFKDGQWFTNPNGTPEYFSPEMLRYRYNYRTDIWSLGVVYYELITGRSPFSRKTRKEVFAAILSSDIIKVDLSVRSNYLINGLLCRNVEKRITLADVINV